MEVPQALGVVHLENLGRHGMHDGHTWLDRNNTIFWRNFQNQKAEFCRFYGWIASITSLHSQYID